MPRRKQPAIPDALLDQLLDGSDPRTAFNRDGILDALKKAMAERMLNAEMDQHLSSKASDGRANTRNGYGQKTVLTDTGRLALDIPRDRQGTFDPQLIAKYQRRFPGFDDKIVSLYARGMSVREIQGHLRELYGIDVSPDLISTVTDAVLDEVAIWRNRPLTAQQLVCSVSVQQFAAYLANQPALNVDGGALAHLTNPAVTDTATTALQLAATTGPGLKIVPASGAGTDASANPPALLASLFGTLTVATASGYSVENDRAATIQYVLCPTGTPQPANAAAATAANCTTRLLQGTGANTPGQNSDPPMPSFIGVIYMLGSSSSQQVAARRFP